MTSLTDLPEIHYIEGGSEDNGRHRTEEVNVFVGAGDNDRQDTKKNKSINYMLWCKQFFECRIATNTSVNFRKFAHSSIPIFHCIPLTKPVSL